jgi:hypothetical protein
VDSSVSSSGDGQSWAAAFKTIQDGIDAASDGASVIVASGTYVENVRFNGKNIVLRSADPLDPVVVRSTIIDGGGSGSVVTFAGTENETCVLYGFTIRNGSASIGGGINGAGTHATIQNNVIVENEAENGGGVASCDGAVRGNLIAGNYASECGGGLWDCSASLVNNTIVANSALVGGGAALCDGFISNCIIWGNAAGDGAETYESSAPTFSCVQGWSERGEGNISEDPGFVDPDGPDDDLATCVDNDYRLAGGSPCIDAGRNEEWMPEAHDLNGNPRIPVGISSPTVDIGAYEYVPGLVITTTSLAGGVEGEPYSERVQATGGLRPYLWSVSDGSLPEGLGLDRTTGFISGIPTAAGAGTSTFTVRVSDSQAQAASDEKMLSIAVMAAAAALDARYNADLSKVKTEVDGLIPEGSGWWVENNPLYAASWQKFLDLVAKYPQKRDELERYALEVLYRSRQLRDYNELAAKFLSRSTNPEIRRQILDWYLHSALEVPDATATDYRKVFEIADLLQGDKGYLDAARLEEYRCLAEIRLISYPPPESSWWVKGNPLFANSYLQVLALREGRPARQLEIIEYEALKILVRSQQYVKFCQLVEEFLPHIMTSWRTTMVLDWYLHCASCWGAGNYEKTIQIGKRLENEPDYWDRGRIVNFVFDTILRYRGKEEAYPYLLEKLRNAADEKEVLMALKYSYQYPGIFDGMTPEQIAALYRSREELIPKTEENVDAIVKLRTTVAGYEAMTGRGI